MNREDLKSLQRRVTLLRSEGKYKETIETGHYLLNYGKKVNDYKSILTAHINIAVSYYCLGDIEEAFNSVGEYDKICSKHGDDADRLNLYNIIFILYEYNNDYSKAKETLKKSLELGRKLKHYNMLSNTYSNYSHILMKELKYEEALEMARLGLEAAKLHKPESLILEIRVKLNMGLAYIGLRDFQASRLLIDEIISHPILDSFIREKAQCNILKAEWHCKQEQYKEAYQFLTYAKGLVESYDDLYFLKDIHERIYKLCDLMGDIEKGYLAQREYIKIMERINEKELGTTAIRLDIKHNLAAIEKRANTDFLTGLYNRSYLEETTNKWLKAGSVKKESIACIVLDIDNFKDINDEFGHLIGDEIIKLIGKTCSSLIRGQDMIGRYGGDEFVIILRGSTLEQGQEAAERLREKLQDLDIERLGKSIAIRASMGVADNQNGKILTFNDLFHQADMRLYRAKENGKDQICAFE